MLGRYDPTSQPNSCSEYRLSPKWQRLPLCLYQNAQQLAQLFVHFCFGVHRAPHLCPKHLAITRPQTGDMTANR
jgi:hypothetical protein